MRLKAIGAAVFLLLAQAPVLGQSSLKISSSSSLPDAPSEQNSAPSRVTSLIPSHLASSVIALSFRGAALRESERVGACCSVSATSSAVFRELPENDAFTKDMAKLLRHNVVFRPATSGGLLRRAAEAASSVAIVRAPDGKGRLNTSYLLGVLSSAALHTAYRPYWNRSVSAPFSDFGSTVGNDAGMNLLHQFAPGLQELVKNHTPKFVTKLAAGIVHR